MSQAKLSDAKNIEATSCWDWVDPGLILISKNAMGPSVLQQCFVDQALAQGLCEEKTNVMRKKKVLRSLTSIQKAGCKVRKTRFCC